MAEKSFWTRGFWATASVKAAFGLYSVKVYRSAMVRSLEEIYGNLGREWEGLEAVRERLRQTRLLCQRPPGHKYCEANRKNCVENDFVLMPVLGRMGMNDRKLPSLDILKREITTVYRGLAMEVEHSTVYTLAVEVKRLSSFVKRRACRKEVTKVWMSCLFICFLGQDVKFHLLLLALDPKLQE